MKVGAHGNFETKLPKISISGEDPQFPNIVFKINEVDLL